MECYLVNYLSSISSFRSHPCYISEFRDQVIFLQRFTFLACRIWNCDGHYFIFSYRLALEILQKYNKKIKMRLKKILFFNHSYRWLQDIFVISSLMYRFMDIKIQNQSGSLIRFDHELIYQFYCFRRNLKIIFHSINCY